MFTKHAFIFLNRAARVSKRCSHFTCQHHYYAEILTPIPYRARIFLNRAARVSKRCSHFTCHLHYRPL